MSVGQLRKTNSNRSLEWLVTSAAGTDLNMSPPYQRGLVWSQEQKVKLIDSIFWGMSLPAIYLRELEIMTAGPYLEVIDGKQRISALMDWFGDRLECRGKRWSTMTVVERRRWANEPIPVIIVHGMTEAEAVELYNRINFCGVPHEQSHCLSPWHRHPTANAIAGITVDRSKPCPTCREQSKGT